MSDLLSAWVLSSSGSDSKTGLSSALDQARLSYHAQEVRRMAAAGDTDTESLIKERKELKSTSSKGSLKRSKKRGVTSKSVANDSGVMSGSNSTVTDVDRWIKI